MAKGRRDPGENLPPGFDDSNDDDNVVPTTNEGATDGDVAKAAEEAERQAQEEARQQALAQQLQEARDAAQKDPNAPDDPAGVPSGSVARTESFRHRVQPPEGYIIRKGEPLTIPGEETQAGIRVLENVYREVILRGSKTPTYTLVHRKGTIIAKSALGKIS